jgi:hypothetical protein
MFTKHDDIENVDEFDVEDNSIWTRTHLHNFSSKCIMTEHHLCHDPKCACLCHQKKEKNTKHE